MTSSTCGIEKVVPHDMRVATPRPELCWLETPKLSLWR